ncbi:MAG: hypothetical protein KGH50_03030 [Candidatus Micrarchaeota archaeon]|nr:hypothetical protein [Candidatus Micrarchaeota archaeon]
MECLMTYASPTIGSDPQNFGTLNGSVANVQLYNTTLDPSSIKAVYQEGIGGAPIDLQHLLGWWPLNGNAQDYSGNNHHGTLVNSVVWNANWQPGYSLPTT